MRHRDGFCDGFGLFLTFAPSARADSAGGKRRSWRTKTRKLYRVGDGQAAIHHELELFSGQAHGVLPWRSDCVSLSSFIGAHSADV
jgi:hypothetical protein